MQNSPAKNIHPSPLPHIIKHPVALREGHILAARTNVRSHDENLDLLLAGAAIPC